MVGPARPHVLCHRLGRVASALQACTSKLHCSPPPEGLDLVAGCPTQNWRACLQLRCTPYCVLTWQGCLASWVCTSELGTVAQLQDEFSERGVQLVALSCNPLGSHKQWV